MNGIKYGHNNTIVLLPIFRLIRLLLMFFKYSLKYYVHDYADNVEIRYFLYINTKVSKIKKTKIIHHFDDFFNISNFVDQ